MDLTGDLSSQLGTPSVDAQEVSKILNDVSSMDAKTLWTSLKEFIVDYTPKLLVAFIALIIGIILIRLLMSFMRKTFTRSRLDPALHKFMLSMLRVALYIILGITVVGLLGVPITSLITLLGVFGLAVSLAVKDSLSNLAGGISVLFTKPFSLGDYVSIGGNEGTIKEIRLNYTILKTYDNKQIHIPNGDVAKAQIVNFTGAPTRRLDLEFSIGYEDDMDQAKEVISNIVSKHPLALKDPEPVVRVIRHGDSAIVIGCRVWVNTPDYWNLNYDLLEEVKRQFDQKGITIPYNQMEVHITKNQE